MRIAFLSESDADETFLREITSGILKAAVHRTPLQIRKRGWPAVRQVLPSVLKYLWYRTDAEGLVAVVDSNSSVLHSPDHAGAPAVAGCRLCDINQLARSTLAELRAVPNRFQLPLAFGLAVPAIEAWYIFGHPEHAVSEARWRQGITGKNPPYTKLQLKEWAYGTSRPSLSRETEIATIEARRLVGQSQLDGLERHFPAGFGALAHDLKLWNQQPPPGPAEPPGRGP